jgi:hypothetical protein
MWECLKIFFLTSRRLGEKLEGGSRGYLANKFYHGRKEQRKKYVAEHRKGGTLKKAEKIGTKG